MSETVTTEQLISQFRLLGASEDRMERSKEAEAIKSAFYRLISQSDSPEMTQDESVFKMLYADYKNERAEYNRKMEAAQQENLNAKKEIIEKLKALVDGESVSFAELRALQEQWRLIGQVPATDFKAVNSEYQLQVEKFYDKAEINRELRDLDFKKNLEAKIALCEEAESLCNSEDIVDAFSELQKLHDAWKELGPVDKENRESIWERFKQATAVINKSYQAHFEEIKASRKANCEVKTSLCQQAEEIAAANIGSMSEWNTLTDKLKALQQQWKETGPAERKDNQALFERFRAACDKFFESKKAFYEDFRNGLDSRIKAKEEIVREAEALKTSTEWKLTADKLISLQNKWKETGNVPRKKGDELWKQFRAACDEFFANRDKNAKPENNFYGNLKAKKSLIEEILAYEVKEGQSASEAAAEFTEKWNAIGFVPFKEKDNIAKAFKDAMHRKFPAGAGKAAQHKAAARPRSEEETLIRKYNALQQEISTYENNIGFFSGSSALVEQMKEKIDSSKKELEALGEKIRLASSRTNE